ncbi:MAG TPA: hypothetical protein VII24_10850 [Pseudolabrys sp.]|jgi:hypothetical protein
MNFSPMNLLPLCRSRHRIAVLVTAFGLALAAAPVAHAFTFDDQSNTNSDGSAKYVDPDRQGSRFGTGGGTTLRQGNTTFQFGPQRSFDQRYNNDRMFDPLGRPGESDNR